MERYKEYYAFISYKREDEKWAKWLADELEHYHLPVTLNGKDLPKNLRPIFRDVDELSAGNLPAQIYHALSISKNLIVVCSPRSAESEWVDKEISDFIKIKGGKADNIFPFIIEGTPFAKNAAEECFPAALRYLSESEERLGGNINEQGGRNAAVVKVIAGMLGVGFDTLWQKYEREQKKKRNLIISAAILAFLFISGFAFWMYWQNLQTQKANWKMMENQAKAVAEKAKKEIQHGNVFDSILALLEVIPQKSERPYVGEVESALRESYDSLCSGKWNYRRLEDDELPSEIVTIDRKDTIHPQLKSHIINWYKSLGLSKEPEIVCFNKCRNIALIEKPIPCDDDFRNPYVLVVYDCNNNKELFTIDNDGDVFDIGASVYVCRSAFSTDGSRLLLSYSFGGGAIVNLDDFSQQHINCGNGDCYHYSNWYAYTKNGKILHSSRFENALKIIDTKTLSVIDSIVAPNGEEIWEAYMNNDEDKCWMHSGNDFFVFYRFIQKQNYCSSKKGYIKYEHNIFNEDTLIDKRYFLTIKDKRLRFKDLKGKYKEWLYDGDYGCQVLGIIDEKYLVVDNNPRFLNDYSVIEMFSGVEMCHFQNEGPLYYNPTTKRFLIYGFFDGDTYRDDVPFVCDFPSFKQIVLKCRQITAGMQLTESSRRLFFLEQ